VERKVSTASSLVNAPSWGSGDRIIYNAVPGGGSDLELSGTSLTGDENAFPFRVSWASANEFFYVSDGKIRKRNVGGGEAQTIPFSATLQVTTPQYVRRRRDFDTTTPRQA